MDTSDTAKLALAEQIKSEGNTLYKTNKLQLASEKYELAANTLPANSTRRSVYLCNKSMCCLKLEQPGQALVDAEAAITSDPLNIKAYYRKGIALYAMMRLKEAISALSYIVTDLKIKNNKDVNEKLKILKKILKQRLFLKAIEYEDETDQLDPNSLSIPTDYTGPSIPENEGGSISKENVMEIIAFLEAQKKLPKKYVWGIIKRAQQILNLEPNLNFLRIQDGLVKDEETKGANIEPENLEYNYSQFDTVRHTIPQITVCGDIHGKHIGINFF